jgi:hypothetical protein
VYVETIDEAISYFRKFIGFLCVKSCFSFILSNVIFVYTIFLTDEAFDFVLAPFVTHISVSTATRYTVKVFYTLMFLFNALLWLFLHMTTRVLALLFYRQFSIFNRCFQQSVDVRGRFVGDLRSFRRRHNEICLAVEKVDGFLMLTNVAGFLFHSVEVVILLFLLMFCKLQDNVLKISVTFTVLGNALCLVWATVDGIMVNHEVSEIVARLFSLIFTKLTVCHGLRISS